MDASAITSAAQAVHQELVRKLADQARINRLADQLRRARPGLAFPSPVRSGAAMRTPGSHTNSHLHAQPDAGSWLSPTAPGPFSFGPAATGGPPVPGPDATAGV